MGKDRRPLSHTEYWETVAEIDATIFCIEQLAREQVSRKPIEKMVDEATGYDKERTETLEYWSKRLKKLMDKLPPDDWHFKKADTALTDLQDTGPEAGADVTSKAQSDPNPQGDNH